MRVLRPSSTCYIRWASKDWKKSVKRQFSVPDSADSSTCSGRCEHIWITRQEYERGRVATATLITDPRKFEYSEQIDERHWFSAN